MPRLSRVTCSAIVLLGCTILAAPANAQPMSQGGGPGMMMGPHIIGPGFGRMCGPGPAGFVEWRIEQMAPSLKLTAAQRAKFDELKSASASSTEALRRTCAADSASTMPARMDAMERRMEAMLAASKAIRPPLDAFYASLTDEQRAQLDTGTGRHRFWRWRDRW